MCDRPIKYFFVICFELIVLWLTNSLISMYLDITTPISVFSLWDNDLNFEFLSLKKFFSEMYVILLPGYSQIFHLKISFVLN